MTILYTSSDATLVLLVQEFGAPMGMMREGAFRKRVDNCPHCEYEPKEWLIERLVVEIALIVDLKYGPIVNPEESATVICECPRCGKKNVYHYPLRMLRDEKFIDREKIEAEMERRGLTKSGFKKKTELEKIVAQSTQEARLVQRLAEAQAGLSLGMAEPIPDYIPDFEIPCGGDIVLLGDDGFVTGEREPCTVVWTKENTNPRWMSPDYLVVRCPNCGHQRSIQDELRELGLLDKKDKGEAE